MEQRGRAVCIERCKHGFGRGLRRPTIEMWQGGAFLLYHFCTGGKRARRFKRSDPKFKAPAWCPMRKTPCELRVYALKSSQDWYMHHLLSNDSNDPVHIPEYRYALVASSEIELTPQEFWKRCQSEPWTNLLHIEIPLYSVVEIDDGLLPAFFYKAVDGLKLVPYFNAEKARANRMEESV